jgi:ABC-2 type transport system permease protein
MKMPEVFTRKNRILLNELTKTDFKLRYQGSVLGYLWALIRPMLLFGILYLVFAKFLRFGDEIPFYPVYLLTGTVLWSFFTECTNQGIQSLIIRSGLMRKIFFPKWIIVLSATTTALINLGINLLVVVIFALASGVSFSLSWLLVPILILELYLLSIGLALFLGSINVKYRDVGSIWEVLLQALFYAVPIIYPLSLVVSYNDFAAKILMLNPIAQVIQDIRFSLIAPETITGWGIIENIFLKFVPILITIIILAVGIMVFKKKSKYFAEEI